MLRQGMPSADAVAKCQADAGRRFFRDEAGRPRFTRRGRDSVTIPQDVRIRDGRPWFPKIGWLRLRSRGGKRPHGSGHWYQPLDLDFVRVLHRLRQIVGSLESQPRVGTAPECLVEANCHRR